MRGVLVTEWIPFDQLRLAEVAAPTLGPRDVRIRIQAAGVSFATSLVVQGKYQRKPPLPFVPGTEVAGIVIEKGLEANRFTLGDRVCAVLDWGGLAEETCAHEVNVFKLPDSLSFARAIAFTNSYATSAAALTWPHLLKVQAGDWLLVHGASGGVGIAAVEIGKLLGATVIASASSQAKLNVARDHGADYTINYSSRNFRDEVLGLSGGRGVDAVYDPVGGEVFMESLRCLAPEGRIMPVGFAGGAIPQIPANLLLVKNLSVCGLNMGLYYGWSPQDMRYVYEDRVRALMNTLFGWFVAGKINPSVDTTYPLEAFQQAMDDVLARRAIGRVALVMDEEARRLTH
ncbi:MAG: NADPH:quinone oxidoreductase family protein [Gammaproteobacteria bacterium]|nr:NADPH:quinone oxidoreductase family protein [Gammaproteobacteria bacterium]